MSYFLPIHTYDELLRLDRADDLPAFNGDLIDRHAVDAHWVFVQDDRITAHCSLWWKNVPSYPEQTLGFLGHYAAKDLNAAHRLLEFACQELVKQGCTLAIAPIDGNTWNRYRLIRDRGEEPIFFLEPDNPDEYCDQFQQSGFSTLATYSSALNTNLIYVDPRMTKVAERLEAAGVKIRSINIENFEQELEKIYQLCLISFRQNFLYTSIALPDFIAQYSQIKPYLRPEFVLIAEDPHQTIGFLFAVPDLLQAQRGEKVNTIILKTVAVLPERQFAGLGSFLVSRCHEIAHQMGFDRVIHALMHDDNKSRNISDRYAQTIRKYALFAKQLSS